MVALDAYFAVREFGKELSGHDPRIVRASQVLNSLDIHPIAKRNSSFRDPDGVRRRFGYFKKLEAGLDIKGREAYRRVWERYKFDTEQLRLDAADITNGIYVAAEALEPDQYDSTDRDLSLIVRDPRLMETEKDALVKARKGQGAFRRDLIAFWRGCAVTGCRKQALLVASHIKPWAQASNAERLDPFNGILLSPTWDRLLDKGYIAFANHGDILLSDYLSAEDRQALGIESTRSLRFNERHLKYVAYHRKSVFKA